MAPPELRLAARMNARFSISPPETYRDLYRETQPVVALEQLLAYVNRVKKSKVEAGALGGSSKGQFDPCLPTTAEKLATEHGVSPAAITPDQFTLLLGRRYNRAKKAAHGRADRDFSVGQSDPPKTAEKLATEHGVSPATVKRAGQYADAGQAVQPGEEGAWCRGWRTRKSAFGKGSI